MKTSKTIAKKPLKPTPGPASSTKLWNISVTIFGVFIAIKTISKVKSENMTI
jgi:hypothetical protein